MTKDLATIREQLAKQFDAPEESTSKISLSHGQMKINNESHNDIQVIIVGANVHRTYYEGTFDPDNIMPPKCYSYDQEGPHEESDSPQSKKCKGCPMNEWGSAPVGKGKACKEKVKLLMLAGGDLDGQMYAMNVSTTQVKKYGNYQKALSAGGKLPLEVLTKISSSPNAKWANVTELKFEALEPLSEEQLEVVFPRAAEANEELFKPFPKTEKK